MFQKFRKKQPTILTPPTNSSSDFSHSTSPTVCPDLYSSMFWGPSYGKKPFDQWEEPPDPNKQAVDKIRGLL